MDPWRTRKSSKAINEEVQFECKTCGHKGSSVSVLEKHILDTHVRPDDNGRFPCDECDGIFDDKDSLWNQADKHTML